MSADTLLSKLDRVKATGQGRWVACCPSHADKRPSMAVRELDDGRLLLHCFAGCSAAEIIGAVGLEFADLFPERLMHHGKPERRPIQATDALRCIGFEALVVLATAAVTSELNEVARDRLSLASARIQSALSACGVSHG